MKECEAWGWGDSVTWLLAMHLSSSSPEEQAGHLSPSIFKFDASAPGCPGPTPQTRRLLMAPASAHSSGSFLPACSWFLPGLPLQSRGALGRAEHRGVSWGIWVVLGIAGSCAVTCSGLEGDSRTGGHQAPQ